MDEKQKYRTVWISDLHLGTKACQVEALLRFLSSMRCEHLFLVGDIIDLWSMKRKWYWPQTHNDVIRKILKRASKGTQVTYIPGNHDENFRGYLGLSFGGVEIKREAFHVTADGKRVLMIHGDEFDTVVTNHHIITWFGDWAYDLLLAGGRVYNWMRRKFNWPYFSLAAYAKMKVKYIVDFVSNYQESLLRYARARKADIIITGHIHRPEIKPIEELLYANCGDWVENCTALVEHFDGRLEILFVERDETAGTPIRPEETLVETLPLMTIASVLTLLVAFSLFLVLVQALAQRAVIQTEAPPLPGEFPPVSILKPLKGVDADLKENLRSLYRIEYPDFEVILGTEDAQDPALAVAQRVAAEFPHVRSVVLSSGAVIGYNPKVNNLSNLVLRSRHPLLLISDSNIRVPQDYLKDLVAHRAQAGGGLVWSLFRGVGGRGLGGWLEALQLNVPVMGGVSAVMRILRRPVCVGKSMLLHREELEAVGGFRFLGQFLAEDQVCAEEFRRLGRPVTVSGNLIDNVLGRRTLKEFVGRHLRWARLRRRVNFGGYLSEFLLNPVFLALAVLAALRSADAALVAGLALAGTCVVNASTDRVLGLRKPVWVHPLLELALSFVRGVLWFVPFFSSTVVWRGNVLSLGARTRIELKVAAPADDGLFDTRERHAPA